MLPDSWVLVQTLHNVRFFASVATDQKMQKKLITETVNTFFRWSTLETMKIMFMTS